MLLAPLQELSTISHSDIRQKQLDCVLHVLHASGESLAAGWPPVLSVIGAVGALMIGVAVMRGILA